MDFKALLSFLKNLSKNNNKAWFDTHKKEYDTLRKQWVEFVAQTIEQTGNFDQDIAMLEPKNCIFRINRDVRFSNDKSPYKNNFGMSLSKGGKKAEFCGYYLHVQPGACFLAGGAYMPMPDKLAAIRQEIDYNLDEFLAIINHKSFKKHFGSLSGEKLQRPPKGYDTDNPGIALIKHKSFLAEYKITDQDLVDEDFPQKMMEVFKAMQPLNEFLNRAISEV
jgi:uncharacterized protein (TIGR02453 family)